MTSKQPWQQHVHWTQCVSTHLENDWHCSIEELVRSSSSDHIHELELGRPCSGKPPTRQPDMHLEETITTQEPVRGTIQLEAGESVASSTRVEPTCGLLM